MRRILILAMLTLLAGYGRQATATATAPRYLFIGDSLTGGWYASTQATDYMSLVTARERAVAIDTDGTYGVSTVEEVANLQHNTPPQANVIVLELGTNDISEPIATFAQAYAQMVDLLKQAESNARWVCLGVWRDPQQDGVVNPGWEYDQVIQADCPGTFVWLGGLYMTWAYHGPVGRATWKGEGDWFHPNDAGHVAIATAIEAVIG